MQPPDKGTMSPYLEEASMTAPSTTIGTAALALECWIGSGPQIPCNSQPEDWLGGGGREEKLSPKPFLHCINTFPCYVKLQESLRFIYSAFSVCPESLQGPVGMAKALHELFVNAYACAKVCPPNMLRNSRTTPVILANLIMPVIHQ